MKVVRLTRTETGDDGTFGLLVTPSLLQLYTAELPWRDNHSDRSCIPAGKYLFVRVISPKHGPTYEAKEVPGRTNIQIHAANFAGDVDRGLKSNLLGCIGPGRSIGEIAGQKAVTSSRDALDAFEADMEGDQFEMVISWRDGINPESNASPV